MRNLLWGVAWGVVGCVEGRNEPPEVAIAPRSASMQAAGPDTLVLDGVPVTGRTVTFRLSGVDPNTLVRIFLSGTGAGGTVCKNAVCLDLTAPVSQPANVLSDAAGDVALTVTIPANSAGRTAWYQAVRKVGGVTGTTAVRAVEVVAEQNILVLLLDDLGVDQLGVMGIGTEIAPTPRIDALAAEGILFRHAYSQPLCSPTRATILTGRHAWRTGVGTGLYEDDDFALSHDEILIPEMLDAGGGAPYDHSYIGKWHLGTVLDSMVDHPNVHGFSYYGGSLMGVGTLAYSADGLPQTHTDWVRVENGVAARSTVYADTDHIDTAIARSATMPEPWFLMVGLLNAHNPVHEPPTELFSGPEVGDTVADHQFHWMIEAADTEIGRLLDGIDPAVLARTTIILLGDNGTDGEHVAPELDPLRQKKSMFEGGVHVPMIVAGPLVSTPGREVDHLVETTDLFPTIAAIAGATLDPLVEIDGVSLLPYVVEPNSAAQRTHVFAERTDLPGFAYTKRDQMVRDTRYKLIRFHDHDELYDLEGLDWEGTDLLANGADAAETAIVEALAAHLPE